MAKQKVSKGYDFSGIYVPITTPFNNDESIAWDKLESNIKKMNSTKVKGYVVQGSTGEFCYLSTEEKLQTIERVGFDSLFGRKYLCNFKTLNHFKMHNDLLIFFCFIKRLESMHRMINWLLADPVVRGLPLRLT